MIQIGAVNTPVDQGRKAKCCTFSRGVSLRTTVLYLLYVVSFLVRYPIYWDHLSILFPHINRSWAEFLMEYGLNEFESRTRCARRYDL